MYTEIFLSVPKIKKVKQKLAKSEVADQRKCAKSWKSM